MTENTAPTTEKELNQFQKAWNYLTKQQRIALGVLSFLVLILPLSLLVIKTQTNIFPKAAPITPPVSPSPVPSPPITPPISPIPSPWVSPSPNVSPSPWPVPLSERCQSCNSSLPPSTPYSRCMPGLVCRYEEPECVGDTCPMIVGASGLCVNPGETVADCQTSTDPISLSGDTLPQDPRITWFQLNVNYALLQDNPSILSLNEDYNNNSPRVLPIEDGYGQFYMIHPSVMGRELEILFMETEINTKGSYIGSVVLYGPDQKKIKSAGTRLSFNPTSTGPYYVAAHTFDHKEGQVNIAVNDEYRKYIFPFVKRIDKDSEPLWENYEQTGYRLGRKAADFFLQVPWIKGIDDTNSAISFTKQTDHNEMPTENANLVVSRSCPQPNGENGPAVPIRVKIRQFNLPELDQLRKIKMKIYPEGSSGGEAYYKPGYNYTVRLIYPNKPNEGWVARFSTTAQSGVFADINDDAAVDISDYSLLVSEFMKTNNFIVSDLNCDGIVDLSDYSLLIGNISL